MSCTCPGYPTPCRIQLKHLTSVKCQLTVFHIRDDCDSGCGELWAQTAPHGHAEGDIEALFVFIQRVINYHHPAGFLHLSLVEAQDAVMVLGPGDVIRVGQHCGGNGAFGWNWEREKKKKKGKNRKTGGKVNYSDWEGEQPAALPHIINGFVQCLRTRCMFVTVAVWSHRRISGKYIFLNNLLDMSIQYNTCRNYY